MELPPLGTGISPVQYSYCPQDDVEEVAKTFREQDIPAIYTLTSTMDGYRVFTFDQEAFRILQALSLVQGYGFKVVTIIDPGVKKRSQIRYIKTV